MGTTPGSESMTSSEFTQRTMLSALTQRPWLIALGIGMGIFLLTRLRRPPAQERAARRLVRDLRHVDDVGYARDVLGSNVPIIIQPALLAILEELERLVHRGLRNLERSIRRL
jgi:hypothetical protein